VAADGQPPERPSQGRAAFGLALLRVQPGLGEVAREVPDPVAPLAGGLDQLRFHQASEDHVGLLDRHVGQGGGQADLDLRVEQQLHTAEEAAVGLGHVLVDALQPGSEPGRARLARGSDELGEHGVRVQLRMLPHLPCQQRDQDRRAAELAERRGDGLPLRADPLGAQLPFQQQERLDLGQALQVDDPGLPVAEGLHAFRHGPAGDHHPGPGAAGQQVLHPPQVRDGVEHQQELATGRQRPVRLDLGGQRLEQLRPRQAERVEQQPDRLLARTPADAAEEPALREPVAEPVREIAGQAGLADPGRAGDDREAAAGGRRLEELDQLLELAVADRASDRLVRKVRHRRRHACQGHEQLEAALVTGAVVAGEADDRLAGGSARRIEVADQRHDRRARRHGSQTRNLRPRPAIGSREGAHHQDLRRAREDGGMRRRAHATTVLLAVGSQPRPLQPLDQPLRPLGILGEVRDDHVEAWFHGAPWERRGGSGAWSECNQNGMVKTCCATLRLAEVQRLASQPAVELVPCRHRQRSP
jgi:hypothetical protein